MEIVFESQELADLCEGKKLKNPQFRSNPALAKQFKKAVDRLRAVSRMEQLYQFHGLNYEKLKGNRLGTSSVRINDQYRLLFAEVLNDQEPPVVELLRLQEISKHYE
jgi:proteic killer suppression protein